MRLLRPLALVLGLLVALGVLAGRRTADRYVATLEPVAPPEPAVAPSATPGQRVARLLLGAVGVGVLLVGLWKLVHAVLPASYGWLVVFLAGAIVLHDALIAPVLVVLRSGAHRRFRRLPALALAIISGAFLVVGLLVVVVVPELWAQQLGPANPTVLPGAYGLRLLGAAIVVAVGTAVAVAVVVLRTRRARPPASPGPSPSPSPSPESGRSGPSPRRVAARG